MILTRDQDQTNRGSGSDMERDDFGICLGIQNHPNLSTCVLIWGIYWNNLGKNKVELKIKIFTHLKNWQILQFFLQFTKIRKKKN